MNSEQQSFKDEEEEIDEDDQVESEEKAPVVESKKETTKAPPTAQAGKGDKKGDKNKKKGKRRSYKDSSGGKGRAHVDILGETAMNNALYICHSVQELLFWRGYQWIPGGKKQKKKGKK